MTKEEVLTAIREVAEKLGHPPSFSQLEDMTPMRRRHIRNILATTLWALQECGLTSGQQPHGYRKRCFSWNGRGWRAS